MYCAVENPRNIHFRKNSLSGAMIYRGVDLAKLVWQLMIRCAVSRRPYEGI